MDHDEKYPEFPTKPSDRKELPVFLDKIPTLIDNEELEDKPSGHHPEVLNQGIFVYMYIYKNINIHIYIKNI